MNPFSAGPLLTSLTGRFVDPIKYEFAGIDGATGWKSYILHSPDVVEWVENMASVEWQRYAAEKEYGVVLIAHSMSPQLETLFLLRWA